MNIGLGLRLRCPEVLEPFQQIEKLWTTDYTFYPDMYRKSKQHS